MHSTVYQFLIKFVWNDKSTEKTSPLINDQDYFECNISENCHESWTKCKLRLDLKWTLLILCTARLALLFLILLFPLFSLFLDYRAKCPGGALFFFYLIFSSAIRVAQHCQSNMIKSTQSQSSRFVYSLTVELLINNNYGCLLPSFDVNLVKNIWFHEETIKLNIQSWFMENKNTFTMRFLLVSTCPSFCPLPGFPVFPSAHHGRWGAESAGPDCPGVSWTGRWLPAGPKTGNVCSSWLYTMLALQSCICKDLTMSSHGHCLFLTCLTVTLTLLFPLQC